MQRIIQLVLIVAAVSFSHENDSVMAIKTEKFAWADLISNYSWLSYDIKIPVEAGGTATIGVRWQNRWSIFQNQLGIYPHFGKDGNTVYKCKKNCKFPKLVIGPTSVIYTLSPWKGVWYYLVSTSDDDPYFLFGKAEGNKWIPISREEFPLEIAIQNVINTLGKSNYMARDSTRINFSLSNEWDNHKSIWFFLLTGQKRKMEYGYTRVKDEKKLTVLFDNFHDSEAFPFFLKYIKPHWKFGNPVLDMDFTPYQGMDPGQIPFPDEVGNK